MFRFFFACISVQAILRHDGYIAPLSGVQNILVFHTNTTSSSSSSAAFIPETRLTLKYVLFVNMSMFSWWCCQRTSPSRHPSLHSSHNNNIYICMLCVLYARGGETLLARFRTSALPILWRESSSNGTAAAMGSFLQILHTVPHARTKNTHTHKHKRVQSGK